MKNLGVTLGYLDNIMICIDAAIKGSFTGLDVSVSVSVEEFVLKLNAIMLGLSQDTLNIDLNLYLEFITLYFEGEISQYQINALTRKVLPFFMSLTVSNCDCNCHYNLIGQNQPYQISSLYLELWIKEN